MRPSVGRSIDCQEEFSKYVQMSPQHNVRCVQEEHDDLMSNFMQGSPAPRIRLFVLPSTQSKR